MNQNRIDLYLEYKSTRFKAPQISLTSNGFSTILTDPHCTFFLPAGVHQIELMLLNKDSNDTIVQDGQIVEDLYVVLKEFKINSISFMENLDQISEYSDWSGNPIKTNGWMSFPRPYIITLQTPGYFFKRNLSLLSADWKKKLLPQLINKY